MSSSNDLRTIAMALTEVEESAHFDSTSFRVRGKILATMSGDRAVLKLPLEVQGSLLESHAAAVVLPAHWGRFGWTDLRLEAFERDLLTDLMALAWRQVAPKALW